MDYRGRTHRTKKSADNYNVCNNKTYKLSKYYIPIVLTVFIFTYIFLTY